MASQSLDLVASQSLDLVASQSLDLVASQSPDLGYAPYVLYGLNIDRVVQK